MSTKCQFGDDKLITVKPVYSDHNCKRKTVDIWPLCLQRRILLGAKIGLCREVYLVEEKYNQWNDVVWNM